MQRKKEYEKIYDELQRIAEKLSQDFKNIIDRVSLLREKDYYKKYLQVERVNLQCPIKQNFILALNFQSGEKFVFLYKDDKDKNLLPPMRGADQFKADILINRLSTLLTSLKSFAERGPI